MKTAEEILRKIGNGVISKSIAMEAMKAYAEQEVKKHLQIAADNCRIDKAYRLDEADKSSITGITIELT